MDEIIEKVKQVPTTFGVYYWLGPNKEILYIGKANNLRNRMMQYFKGTENSRLTKFLVEKIVDFKYQEFTNEKEALLFEKKEIKNYKPRYNVLLLDDKTYSYLKLTIQNNEIKLIPVYRNKTIFRNENKTAFFGPFPPLAAIRDLRKFIYSEFIFNPDKMYKERDKAKLEDIFIKISDFLSLNIDKSINFLNQEIQKHSENLSFEIAEKLDKVILILQNLKEKQNIDLMNYKNLDIITIYHNLDNVFFNIAYYRNGILTTNEIIKQKKSFNYLVTILDFINTFYYQHPIRPIIKMDAQFKEISQEINSGIKVDFVSKGKYKNIIDANYDKLIKSTKVKENEINYLKEIQAFLQIKKEINKIVIFDNSHFNSKNIIGGALIIQENNSYFLSSKIKDENKGDFLQMKKNIEFFLTKEKIKPDLIFVDGGLAQINAAKKVLKDLKLNILVYGLVKDDKHRTKEVVTDKNQKLEIPKHLFLFLIKIQDQVDLESKKVSKKTKMQKIKKEFENLKFDDGIKVKREE